MIYMKHPTLGNANFEDSEQSRLESEGWVKWPRTAEQKVSRETKVEQVIEKATVATQPAPSAPTFVEEKRGPGRPKTKW